MRDPGRHPERRMARLLIAGFALATSGATAVAWASGLRWNATPSYPRGLWRIVAPYDPAHARGRRVLFCPPDTAVFRLGRARGYLAAGGCPGGMAPLIKRVVAVASDRVEVSAQGVRVNGALLPHSAPLASDSASRVLPRARGGLVPAGQVWVLSEYHPRSFDSRYYGPVEVSRIQGVVRPVWVWGS